MSGIESHQFELNDGSLTLCVRVSRHAGEIAAARAGDTEELIRRACSNEDCGVTVESGVSPPAKILGRCTLAQTVACRGVDGGETCPELTRVNEIVHFPNFVDRQLPGAPINPLNIQWQLRL